MRSATPKLLHPLCGQPIIHWTVTAARDAGAGSVIVVDSPGRALESVLDGVAVVVQERPVGTADAVKATTPRITAGNTVVVLYGDAPLVSCGDHSRYSSGSMSGRGPAAPSRRWSWMIPPDMVGSCAAGTAALSAWSKTKVQGDATEEELAIHEVNTGMAAFHADALLAALDRVGAENAQGEFDLPDVFPIIRAGGGTVAGYRVNDPSEMLGINSRVDLAAVTAVAQQRILRRLMIAGVTIVNPATTTIDVGVVIEPDVVIAPGSSLLGKTRVGGGTTVGPHTTLIDARVGARCVIVHSYVDGAKITAGARVGPFARL